MKIIWQGQAKPDDPIYTMGLVVAGRQTTPPPDDGKPQSQSGDKDCGGFKIGTPEQARELGIDDVLVISPRQPAKLNKPPTK